MLNVIQTTNLLDALHYCNKYIIDIDKDLTKHFYKIKHAILGYIYNKPTIIEGYELKITGIEVHNHYNSTNLLCIAINGPMNYEFHVPFNNKVKKQFNLNNIDNIDINSYSGNSKETGDLETWMKYYTIVKEIAYRWHVLNPYEDKMAIATRYPNQWKQNWSMFVAAFNKRFKNKYIIQDDPIDKRRCEIIRIKDGTIMYNIFKFKLMKDCTYINYMNRIDKKIKWH